MTLIIREAVESDRSFIQEMFYEAIFMPEGQEKPDFSIIFDPKLSKYTEHWMQPTDLGFIAVLGDEAVGAAWIRLFKSENPGYGFVDQHTPELTIAVKTAFQGQGIGKSLLSRLLQEAAKAGWKNVSLSVTKENTPAVSLYQQAGFVTVSENQEDLVMLYYLYK
jgi:ribosomal protein S18 acetylase RimI-like enzyme